MSTHLSHSIRLNRVAKQNLKFIRPQVLTTRKDKLFPMLTSDVEVRYDQLNFNTIYVKRLDGRLKILSNFVTDLIKFERIELPYHKAQELRPYTERLIIEAIRYGDCHLPTMELANFWLKEKQLVHKLFKVLVPRYVEYTTSFTKLYRLGIMHEHSYKPSEFRINNCPNLGVLELKGNPLPPIPDFSTRYKLNKNNLANILLSEAHKEYNLNKSEEEDNLKRSEGNLANVLLNEAQKDNPKKSEEESDL